MNSTRRSVILFACLIGAAVSVAGAFYFLGGAEKVAASKERARREGIALSACQEALRSAWLDHPGISIPDVTTTLGGGGEYNAAWPTGAGLAGPGGPASAACTYNTWDRKVSLLTINGKTVI